MKLQTDVYLVTRDRLAVQQSWAEIKRQLDTLIAHRAAFGYLELTDSYDETIAVNPDQVVRYVRKP